MKKYKENKNEDILETKLKEITDKKKQEAEIKLSITNPELTKAGRSALIEQEISKVRQVYKDFFKNNQEKFKDLTRDLIEKRKYELEKEEMQKHLNELKKLL